MAATKDQTITVFGGTGFLGCRIVRHLRDREFLVRIAMVKGPQVWSAVVDRIELFQLGVRGVASGSRVTKILATGPERWIQDRRSCAATLASSA